MQRIRFDELCSEVQAFLRKALDQGGIVVVDESGRLHAAVVPYLDPSPAEERRTNEAMQQLWKHTAKAMAEQGITEADIDRVLQEDD